MQKLRRKYPQAIKKQDVDTIYMPDRLKNIYKFKEKQIADALN